MSTAEDITNLAGEQEAIAGNVGMYSLVALLINLVPFCGGLGNLFNWLAYSDVMSLRDNTKTIIGWYFNPENWTDSAIDYSTWQEGVYTNFPWLSNRIGVNDAATQTGLVMSLGGLPMWIISLFPIFGWFVQFLVLISPGSILGYILLSTPANDFADTGFPEWLTT